MYRHSFVVVFKNDEQGTSRIVPIFSLELPFVVTPPVRLELESLALSSIPFIRLLDSFKDVGYEVSTSLWNIELSNSKNNETSSQEEEQ